MYKHGIPDISNISFVILAGGKGSRLSSIVKDRPKILAEIQGRPFLTFLLDRLISVGVKGVILCTGYRAEDVHRQIGETYQSLKVVYSTESEPLGTAGALRNALPYLSSRIMIVINGDSFIEVDFKPYLKWFFKRDRKAALLLTNVKNAKRYGRVTVAEDDSVISFEEKADNDDGGLINAGVYILNKDLLTSIPPHTFYSLERDLLPKMIRHGLFGYRCNGKFIDIGTPESYHLADAFFTEN